MPSDNPKPDFVGIGAQRSATTWLYDVLRANPDIYLPPVKELHYFDRLDRRQHGREDGARGVALHKKSPSRFRRNFLRLFSHAIRQDFQSIAFYRRFLLGKRDDAWYRSLFPPDSRHAGDITPAYASMHPATIRLLTKMNPELKGIYLLRHPVARAWSQFQYERKRAGESATSRYQPRHFQAFLHQSRQRSHGDYLANIENWSRELMAKHLFIGFYDAVAHRTEDLLSNLADFFDLRQLLPAAKANASTEEVIPPECVEAGMLLYGESLDELSSRYGGYFEDWRQGILVSRKTRSVSLIL